MAKSAPETILLIGDPNRIEREAGGAITPGHLLEINSSNAFIVHNSAGVIAYPLFAVENDIAGDDLLHAYASGEKVQANWFRPGDEVLALVANGESIVIGDFLESNGNGELREHTPDSAGAAQEVHPLVGVAMQAIDTSDSSLADPASFLFKIRIL